MEGEATMTALAKLSSLEQSYDQARQKFEHIVDTLTLRRLLR
jgi:hypothetical protein